MIGEYDVCSECNVRGFFDTDEAGHYVCSDCLKELNRSK